MNKVDFIKAVTMVVQARGWILSYKDRIKVEVNLNTVRCYIILHEFNSLFYFLVYVCVVEMGGEGGQQLFWVEEYN